MFNKLYYMAIHSAECRDDPGALTSWNPKSHIRLVVEKLYLLLHGKLKVKDQ
jgi:hypothetical protein